MQGAKASTSEVTADTHCCLGRKALEAREMGVGQNLLFNVQIELLGNSLG